MAAQNLPVIDIGGIDPAVIREANQELARMTKIELPKLKMSLKQQGGIFGRFNRLLRNRAEETILLTKLSTDKTLNEMSKSMQNALMANLSFIERSALVTRQNIQIELKKKTETEKKLSEIEERIREEVRNGATEDSAVVQKYQSEKLKLQEKYAEELATIDGRSLQSFRKLLEDFARATTDQERETIQARIDGQLAGEEESIKLLEKKIQDETILQEKSSEEILKIDESKNKEEFKRKRQEIEVRKTTIKQLTKERDLLKQGNVARKKAQADTVKEYKKGIGGFGKELLSKSFTGGLFGALRGEGFGDLIGNAFNMAIERTGVLSKTIGGASVAAIAYGGDSEEARKVNAETTEQIESQRTTASLIAELLDKQLKILEAASKTAEDTGTGAYELAPSGEERAAKGETVIQQKAALGERAFELMPEEGSPELQMQSPGTLLPPSERPARPSKSGSVQKEDKKEQRLRRDAFSHIIKMSREATTRGSIFTHDTHSEEQLTAIKETITQSLTTSKSNVGTTAAAAAGGAAVAPKAKGGLGGIGGFLSNIAAGVKSFGDTKVFKGAFGLALVASSLIPFAYAVSMMASSGIGAIAGAVGGILALSFAVKMIGKAQGDILKGSLAMLVMSAALIPMAFALSLMSGVNAGGLLASVVAVYALIGALFLLGKLDPYTLLIGAAALLVIGTTMIMVGAGLLMAGAGIMLFSMALERLAAIPFMDLMKAMMAVMVTVGIMSVAIGVLAALSALAPLALASMLMFSVGLLAFGLAVRTIPMEELEMLSGIFGRLSTNAAKLFSAAAGIAAVGLSLIAFAVAAAVSTAILGGTAIFSALASLLGLGEINILDQIFLMAEKADKLQQLASALTTIAGALQSIASVLTQFGGEDIEIGINAVARLTEMQYPMSEEEMMSVKMADSYNKMVGLQGDNMAGKVGMAAGGGSQVNSAMQQNVVGGSQNIMFSNSSRTNDPSIMFSRERYYSMIYR